MENEDVWSEAKDASPYNYVIAHYLMDFLKQPEVLIKRASEVLKKGGMFSCNGPEVSNEHLFWKEVLDKVRLKNNFIDKVLEEKKQEHDKFRQLLEAHYEQVENVKLSNNMKYETAEELFERICTVYPFQKKYFSDNKGLITAYFEEQIAENGFVTIMADSQFWHCYK